MKNENGEVLEVHPYAARFPLMNDEELADLAEDIKANGLKSPLIRDSDGTLIDGRNRLAACKIAEIEPTWIELNSGQNLIAFIVSINLKRRQLKVGQQAMLIALGLDKMSKSANRAAKETGLAQNRISRALFVIENAKDQIELVISGGSSLEAAYEIAQKRKRDAESEQAKTDRLNKQAPDLADQVSEGKLSLAEAIGALEAREKEAEKLAEARQQERELATEHLVKVLLFARSHSVSPKEKADYWISIIDPKFIQDEIRTEHIAECAEVLKHMAKNWSKTYGKTSQSKSETET